MKYAASVLLVAAMAVHGFGMPNVPDVPDVSVPEIEIPGMEILDAVLTRLDEIISSTDSLRWLIPELSTLDDLSAKLEELRETDPDIVGLQEELDALRTELFSAREEIVQITGTMTEEIQEVRSSIGVFVEGLPGSSR